MSADDGLDAETGDLQAVGWNLPPGAKLISYTRPENAFAPATRPRSRGAGPLPTVARFTFVSSRHAKTFRDGRPKLDPSGWQDGSAPHDLLRLLARHPRGAGAEIRCHKETAMPYQFGLRRFRSLQFLTRRHAAKAAAGTRAAPLLQSHSPSHVPAHSRSATARISVSGFSLRMWAVKSPISAARAMASSKG